MTPKTKRFVAREFLILVFPMLMLLVVLISVSIYYTDKISESARVRDEIEVKLLPAEQSKFDFVPDEVDSAAEIEETLLPPPPNPSRTKGLVVQLRHANEQLGILVDREERLLGYDGYIAGVYYMFLFLAYPVRLLVIAIAWSIRVLRSNS